MKKIILITLTAGLLWSCGNQSGNTEAGHSEGATTFKGAVNVDGSSTVYPITEAIAEEFQKANPEANVGVGVSGTGGGFKKFSRKEIDITGASRPIKASEDEACKKDGIEYIELPVAYDGLAVVVHSANDWASSMTVAELKKLWEPAATGKITKWNQIRPEWPNEKIELFGAGTESGTFDYFTEAIVGESKACRSDYTPSENDNVLVQGVSMSKYSLGFFGLAYYGENKDKLKLVAIDDQNDANGKGAILPSETTVVDGTYQPLSRPLFIYVNKEAAAKPQVEGFVKYYMENAMSLVPETGYIPLGKEVYELAGKRFAERKTGSVFLTLETTVGVKLSDVLK